MFSPQETGTIQGASPGAMQRPGNRNLQRVPGTGGRRVAPGSPGDRTNRNSEAGRPVDLGR